MDFDYKNSWFNKYARTYGYVLWITLLRYIVDNNFDCDDIYMTILAVRHFYFSFKLSTYAVTGMIVWWAHACFVCYSWFAVIALVRELTTKICKSSEHANFLLEICIYINLYKIIKK